MPIALLMSTSASPAVAPSPGSRLVSTDGRDLPLEGAEIRAEARGGVARTVVEQRFRNPYAEALTVTYSLPLPAEGAVSAFSFVLDGRRIAGRVQRRDDAREAFELALVQGRSAALLEQDRSSLFTQEIGNIPPGATIVAEITVDQPLAWLDEGAWEWRFPTVVAPRYMGAKGRVPDADRITQDVADGPIPARFTLTCAIGDDLAPGRRPESPSHAMTLTTEGAPGSYRDSGSAQGASKGDVGGGGRITTMRVDEGARLDRDVVVRWPVATPQVGLSLSIARPPSQDAASEFGYGLLTIVPPAGGRWGTESRRFARDQPGDATITPPSRPQFKGMAPKDPPRLPRDLIVLLDTSGSMAGEPLSQARRVTAALIDTLDERDQLEMIEFSSSARRWKKGPASVTPDVKRQALSWLAGLSASGSTEMRTGILEALHAVRKDAQRQVLLVTDGQIGFENEVIAAISDRLPVSSRVHTVGIGSAVNRSLTGPAARAGRGVEVIVGLGEDPERAAKRLVARTDAPLVVDLVVEGSAVIERAPRRLPDLFAGAPALAGLVLRPEGGEILVRGRTQTGTWEQRLSVGPIAAGTGSRAVVALVGRETVEDAELAIAAGKDRRSLDTLIENTGIRFQLATRLTSWIAVTEQVTVDPEAGRRRERMPHELPFGMSAEGVGLRAPGAADTGTLEEWGGLADGRVEPGLEAGLGFEDLANIEAPVLAPSASPMGKIDLKARLGKTPSLPGPVSRSSAAPVKMEIPSAGLPVRSRKTNLLGPWLLLSLLGFGIAYYFTRSWLIALLVAWGLGLVILVLRRLFS